MVEYDSGAALVALRPVLPYIYLCAEVKVSYEIVELSAVCAEKVGALHTDTYLCELKKVAKLTGQDFAVVLNGPISRLGQTVTELHPIATRAESPSEDMSSERPQVPTAHLKASPLSAAVTSGHPTTPVIPDKTVDPRLGALPDLAGQQARDFPCQLYRTLTSTPLMFNSMWSHNQERRSPGELHAASRALLGKITQTPN